MMNLSERFKVRDALAGVVSADEFEALIEAGLTAEELDILYECDVDISSLRKVLAKKVHASVINGDAVTDGTGLLIFTENFGYDDFRYGQYKFLYYIGAEHEYELVAKWKTVTIFRVSDGRLSRYWDSKTLLGEDLENKEEDDE